MAEYPILPMTSEDLAHWRGEIEKARQARQTVQVWWEANMKAYAPSPNDSPDGYGATLNTNRDFTLVERKKADLFYQQPSIQAIPLPLMEGQEALLDLHTNILNQKLGVHGVDVKDLVHRALFDVLCPAGSGFTVMGYESATVPVQEQQQVGEEPMVGSILGLGAMQPIMKTVTVDVPVFEDIFWSWISPKQMLIPASFRSTRWDDAPWLAYECEIPLAVAKSKVWVPSNFRGADSAGETIYFENGLDQAAEDVVRVVILFYKSRLKRKDRPHPQHQTMVVLIEGVDTPAVHKDSPYQDLTEKGTLSPTSLIGFPIHPLTIRPLSDSAYVPSDCTLSRPIVNELNKFRDQMVAQRDANILRWAYNTATLPTDALAKIVRSPIGGMIGLPPEAYEGEMAIKQLPHGTYPRENFSFNDYLDADLARTHALDANQAGVQSDSAQTATEANIRQGNTNARLGLERGVVLDWYVRGVTKYSTLICRFLSLEDAVQILGNEKAQAWDGFRKIVPSQMAFTALPDSALRNDIASERKRALDEYSFFANDPMMNRQKLLQHLLPKLHYPQSVMQTEPPQKTPEPTKPTFNLKGEDMNPLSSQFAIVMEILRQGGYTVSPEAIQEAQSAAMNQIMATQALAAQKASQDTGMGGNVPNASHPGKMAPTESLSKHQSEMTGGTQGIGVGDV